MRRIGIFLLGITFLFLCLSNFDSSYSASPEAPAKSEFFSQTLIDGGEVHFNSVHLPNSNILTLFQNVGEYSSTRQEHIKNEAFSILHGLTLPGLMEDLAANEASVFLEIEPITLNGRKRRVARHWKIEKNKGTFLSYLPELNLIFGISGRQLKAFDLSSGSQWVVRDLPPRWSSCIDKNFYPLGSLLIGTTLPVCRVNAGAIEILKINLEPSPNFRSEKRKLSLEWVRLSGSEQKDTIWGYFNGDATVILRAGGLNNRINWFESMVFGKSQVKFGDLLGRVAVVAADECVQVYASDLELSNETLWYRNKDGWLYRGYNHCTGIEVPVHQSFNILEYATAVLRTSSVYSPNTKTQLNKIQCASFYERTSEVCDNINHLELWYDSSAKIGGISRRTEGPAKALVQMLNGGPFGNPYNDFNEISAFGGSVRPDVQVEFIILPSGWISTARQRQALRDNSSNSEQIAIKALSEHAASYSIERRLIFGFSAGAVTSLAASFTSPEVWSGLGIGGPGTHTALEVIDLVPIQLFEKGSIVYAARKYNIAVLRTAIIVDKEGVLSGPSLPPHNYNLPTCLVQGQTDSVSSNYQVALFAKLKSSNDTPIFDSIVMSDGGHELSVWRGCGRIFPNIFKDKLPD